MQDPSVQADVDKVNKRIACVRACMRACMCVCVPSCEVMTDTVLSSTRTIKTVSQSGQKLTKLTRTTTTCSSSLVLLQALLPFDMMEHAGIGAVCFHADRAWGAVLFIVAIDAQVHAGRLALQFANSRIALWLSRVALLRLAVLTWLVTSEGCGRTYWPCAHAHTPTARWLGPPLGRPSRGGAC